MPMYLWLHGLRNLLEVRPRLYDPLAIGSLDKVMMITRFFRALNIPLWSWGHEGNIDNKVMKRPQSLINIDTSKTSYPLTLFFVVMGSLKQGL